MDDETTEEAVARVSAATLEALRQRASDAKRLIDDNLETTLNLGDALAVAKARITELEEGIARIVENLGSQGVRPGR